MKEAIHIQNSFILRNVRPKKKNHDSFIGHLECRFYNNRKKISGCLGLRVKYNENWILDSITNYHGGIDEVF